MKQKKWLRKFNILLLVVCTILIAAPSNVYASGWVNFSEEAQEKLYGDGTVNSPEDSDGDAGDSEEPNIVEKFVSGLIYKFASWVNNNILVTKYFDFSVDGVIMGRMSSNCPTTQDGVRVAYSQFTLSYGNPWGIIAAWVFATLRGLVYSLFLFYFVIKLIPFAWSNGKKRAELKEFIYNVFFFMFLMYILPYIVDYFIYVRDASIYRVTGVLTDKILDSGKGKGAAGKLLEQWADQYKKSPSIVNALLYGATVGAGAMYLSEYLATALIEMGLFGLIPIVCLNGARDKKSFQDWSATFFPNLLIPFVDSILMIVPVLFVSIFNEISGVALPTKLSTDYTGTYAAMAIVSIIQLVLIFSIKPTRSAILRGINSRFNMQAPKSGVGGLIAMAGMAASRMSKGIGRGAGRNSDSESDAGFTDLLEEAKENDVAQGNYNEASEALRQMGEKDTEDIFGDDKDSAPADALDSLDEDKDPVDAVLDDEGPGGVGDYDDSEFDEEQNADTDGLDDVLADDEDYLGDVPEDNFDSETGVDGEIGNAESPEDLDEVLDGENPDVLGSSNNDEDIVDVDNPADEMSELEGDVTETGTPDDMPLGGDENTGINDGDGSEAVEEHSDTYSNIPGIDKETLDSLEGADRDRYANLAAKDAMEDELAKNEQTIADYKEGISNMDLDIANERSSIAERTQDNASLKGENEALENSIKSDNAIIDSNNNRIAENNSQMAQMQGVDIGNEQGVIDTANAGIAKERADIANRTVTMNSNSQQISRLNSHNDGAEINRLRAENSNLNIQNVESQRNIAMHENDKAIAQQQINSKVGNSKEISEIRSSNDALYSRNSTLNSNISTKQASIATNNSTIANNTMQINSSENNINGYNVQKAQTTRTISSLEQRNTQLSNGIANATKRENTYASNAKDAGMDGSVYKNAEAFANNQKVVQNLKKQANYKNFDSQKFDGVLTPEERAKYTRMRAARTAVNSIGKAAGKVITASAVVGAAYGGPGAMVSAGMASTLGQEAIKDTARKTKNTAIGAAKVGYMAGKGAWNAGKITAEAAKSGLAKTRANKSGKVIKAASGYNADAPYKSMGVSAKTSEQTAYESEKKAVKQDYISYVNKSAKIDK